MLDSMGNKGLVLKMGDFVCNMFHQQPVLQIYHEIFEGNNENYFGKPHGVL